MSVSVVVLAAGKGTRMKSDLPKVLHKVLGRSLLAHALDKLSFIKNQYVVVGHESDMVINSLPSSTEYILQKDQLGTGHAVATVVGDDIFVENKSEFTVVVPGDVPAIDAKDIELLIREVETKSSPVGFLTAVVDNPYGYGRVIRNNEETRIVEEKDCNDDEQEINEINSGIYCFKTDF
jgi:bifunctional UDP-N-acetylglucosamine pyrophosphorylase/glucosamine-1-phosphate N-acetyltransferase